MNTEALMFALTKQPEQKSEKGLSCITSGAHSHHMHVQCFSRTEQIAVPNGDLLPSSMHFFLC